MQGIETVAQPFGHFHAAVRVGEDQGKRQPRQRLQMEKRGEYVAQSGPAKETQIEAKKGRDHLTVGAPEQGVPQKGRGQTTPGFPCQIQKQDEGQPPPAVVDLTEAQRQIAQGRAPELAAVRMP